MSNNFDALFSAILAQGTSSKFAKKEDQKFSNAELMKKYFSPYVTKGQTNAIFKTRILPTTDGTSPFKEVKFHVTKIGGKWLKLLCLREVDGECAMCDTAEALTNQGDKEEAKKYRAATFYIVKVVDRNNEHDGVKFWRFKKNYKNKGELDKIKSLMNIFGNIIHPETGYDLTIECGLDEKGNSQIGIMACVGLPTPLSTDANLGTAWMNDDTTWKDIYRPKTPEYMTDVVYGRASYWDDNLKKYINPATDGVNTPEGEAGEVKHESSPESTPAQSVASNPLLKGESFDNVEDVEDDDLPF